MKINPTKSYQSLALGNGYKLLVNKYPEGFQADLHVARSMFGLGDFVESKRRLSESEAQDYATKAAGLPAYGSEPRKSWRDVAGYTL